MRGKSIRLSPARRIVSDLSYFARRTPLGVMTIRMNIAPVLAARAAAPDRPPLSALLMKGFALVAARHAPLRQAYVKFPWPHLYEYPASVGGVVVEREVEGEAAIFIARVKNPESRPLSEVAALLANAKSAPLASIKDFRLTLALGRFPLLIRRFVWWLGLNLGRQRANYFPTFLISLLGQGGIGINYPVMPFTLFLSIGPISPEGEVTLTCAFDHRGMDGAVVARGMAELEDALNGPIADELRSAGS
ncbi:MAG TPA: hypothetical protein PK812_11775 [Beijerinckiaceae bacterium]|nr:hypothetical protein [Beijerinckiaceae bacterium]